MEDCMSEAKVQTEAARAERFEAHSSHSFLVVRFWQSTLQECLSRKIVTNRFIVARSLLQADQLSLTHFYDSRPMSSKA